MSLIWSPSICAAEVSVFPPRGGGTDEQIEADLPGILAQEIPASCEEECLKAQAVIARTNLYRERQERGASGGQEDAGAQGTGTQENAGPASKTGWSEAEMRAAWGADNYERYLEKIKSAVTRTKGEILTFEGAPIMAAYHAVSSKRTRNASEVPGQEAYRYLAGADSADDILADGFLYIGYMEKQQFADALQGLFANETIAADQMPGALQITKRDSAGYVTEVTYGSTVVNGEAVRDALGLNSACFYFSELEGQIRIVTKGIGHGMGFSQYGANELAKRGYDYQELLNYYYKDVEIEKN